MLTVSQTDAAQQGDTDDYNHYTHCVHLRSLIPLITVPVQMEGSSVQIELDTGAAFSLISETAFSQLFPTKELKPFTIRLCVYSGEPIEVIGSLHIDVMYKKQSAMLIVSRPRPIIPGQLLA